MPAPSGAGFVFGRPRRNPTAPLPKSAELAEILNWEKCRSPGGKPAQMPAGVRHAILRRGGPLQDAFDALGRKIELDESEFSAALRFDMAAARIAAMSNPEIPCGMWLTMNCG